MTVRATTRVGEERAPASHVFIVGCNRSGTSLLRHVLNKSPRVAVAPETHFLRRLSAVGTRRELARIGTPVRGAAVDRFVERVYSGGRTWGASYWAWLQRTVPRDAFRKAVSATDGSDRALFELLLELYARSERPGLSGVILAEKTPTHLYYVPTLLDWYPKARIVHILRDPRAILASKLRKGKVRRREGLRGRLAAVPGTLLDPFADLVDVVHTTKAWLDAVRLHDAYRARHGDAYHLLRFEDLIADPEPVLRSLCAFLGLPFEPAMLEGISVIGSSYEPRHRVAGGFDESVIQRWRGELNPVVRVVVETAAGRRLRRFGYRA